MEKEKTATKIIEGVVEEMCSHYCKYTSGLMAGITSDMEFDEFVEKYCADCPLNRL